MSILDPVDRSLETPYIRGTQVDMKGPWHPHGKVLLVNCECNVEADWYMGAVVDAKKQNGWLIGAATAKQGLNSPPKPEYCPYEPAWTVMADDLVEL